MARGTIVRRSGGYAFRADGSPDPATGKRRQILRQGFRTKREAEAALEEFLSGVRTGAMVNRSAANVGDFLDEWLDGQRSRLKETTWVSYRIAVGRVKARVGKVKLQALSPIDVERFYDGLAETGGKNGGPLSAKTVRNTHVVLRKALDDAERLGLIARNPAAVAKPPVPQQVEHATWSTDDLQDFFGTLTGHRHYGLYVLLATTGMRRGEALGMRWSDLDLDGSELCIRQTITTADGDIVVSSPKTKRSRRIVYLDEVTVAVLRAHRQRQREERLSAGPSWNPDPGLVFCDEIGDPIHPDRITREFAGLVRAAGLPVIRLHDLRHTYATVALKAGVQPKLVSERLGHATTGITLDLYSHVTPGLGREAAGAVAGKIFG